jgi:hypothetical protein
VNLYIAISGGIRESKPEQNLVYDLRSAFQSDFNDVLSKARKGIEIEHQDLIRSGATNSLNQTIVDVMRHGDWYGPSDYDLYQNLADHIGRVTMGVAINILWEFDNAYLVEVDYPYGCEAEKQSANPHGPRDYLICLPDVPHKGFWLYSIDRYKAETHGPTGFWRLDGDPKYANLTLQHIAWSSLHVHQEKLMKKKGQRLDIGPPTADSIFNGKADEHADIKGIFTIPICENPYGEAVSGVLDTKHGQNYPCMCDHHRLHRQLLSCTGENCSRVGTSSGTMCAYRKISYNSSATRSAKSACCFASPENLAAISASIASPIVGAF